MVVLQPAVGGRAVFERRVSPETPGQIAAFVDGGIVYRFGYLGVQSESFLRVEWVAHSGERIGQPLYAYPDCTALGHGHFRGVSWRICLTNGAVQEQDRMSHYDFQRREIKRAFGSDEGGKDDRGQITDSRFILTTSLHNLGTEVPMRDCS